MKKIIFAYLFVYLVLFLWGTAALAQSGAKNYYFQHSGGAWSPNACFPSTKKFDTRADYCSGWTSACAGSNPPLVPITPPATDDAMEMNTFGSCKRASNNANMSTYMLFKKLACPAGQVFSAGTCHTQCEEPETWNPATFECDPPPECEGEGETFNPFTDECEVCTSQQWAGEAMPTYGLALHQCVPDLGECAEPDSPSGGMGVRDDDANVVDSDGTATDRPSIVKCIAAPPTGCTNVTGKLSFNEFDFCQERKTQCDAVGGTYGAVGKNGEVAHICVKGIEPSTCASGSQNWVEDDFGSAFACVPTTPPANVCDGQKYDCDDDGNVDDQDKDGCVDNGTLNDFEACTPKGDPGAPTDPQDPETPNVGENPLDPAEEGAGDCDPTATNYAECAGLDGGLGDLVKDLKDGTSKPDGTGVMPSAAELGEGLYSQVAGTAIVAAASGIGAAFSGSAECPAPTFEVFGTTFALNYHCTLYESVAGILSAAMMAVWSLAAIRLFLTA